MNEPPDTKPAAPTAPTAPSNPQPPSDASPPPPTESPFFAEIDRVAAEGDNAKPAPSKEGNESPPQKEGGAKSASNPSDEDSSLSGQEGKTSTSDAQKNTSEKSESSTKSEKPFKAAELRAAYESLKAKHKALEAEHEKAKKATPTEDPEKPKLIESIQSRDKKISELEERLKLVSYEHTDEYAEKYEKPYKRAAETATQRAVQLKVADVDGNSRNLTAEEFWSLVRIGDEDAAISAAERLFGEGSPKANFVIERRNEIISAWRAGEQAKEEYRKTGAERFKQEREQAILQREGAEKARKEVSAAFTNLNAQAAEKYPHWFKPDDADEKGKTVFEKGMNLAREVFMPTEETKSSPEQTVKKHSAIFMKAGAFDYVAHKLNTATARIAELEAQLAEFKKSEPSGGLERREADKGKPLSFDEEVDRIAAGRR